MGNSEPRRLLGGYEQDIWERRFWMKNAARTAARYAKRVVARRERREGQRVTRNAWKEDQ